MKNITIKSIPFKKMRYPTAGDYWMSKSGNIQLRVNKMQSSKAEMLVVIHELIELFLTGSEGISWKDIDAFDIEFEKKNKDYPSKEPGDDKNAPYYRQHQISTIIEKWLCTEVGLKWKEYNDIVYKSCK